MAMPGYAKIYLNGFCFSFTHFNPLSAGTIDCFLGKLKLDFFYSGWKYLILLFWFRLKTFASKTSNLLWGLKGLKEPGPVNLMQPVRYPIKIYMMFF